MRNIDVRASAKIDPRNYTCHTLKRTGDVSVADEVDGKRLGGDGAFKLVSTEERRPARWVRNLAEISVVEVKP